MIRVGNGLSHRYKEYVNIVSVSVSQKNQFLKRTGFPLKGMVVGIQTKGWRGMDYSDIHCLDGSAF